MARLPRLVLPGHPHVIVHRGQSGQPVFFDASDRQRYLAALHDAARAARVAVHGFGLLANEIRMLVTPETTAGLARMMQSVGRLYVPAFNKKYERSGTPWEGRFRSTVIEAATQLAGCLRFVECFDVRSAAGANSLPASGIDSSTAHHLGERVDPLVTDHPVFWAFGNTPFEREAAYRRFVDQPVSEVELAAILLASLKGWVLGSPSFCASVASETGRRSLPAQKGRPRKNPASHKADLAPLILPASE